MAVLGISYKPNVGDDRESPAYKVIKLLQEKNAKFDTYDPYFLNKSTKKSLPATLNGKDAVLIVTAHKEFVDYNYSEVNKLKVVVDGRNCLDNSTLPPQILYTGIGVS